MNRLTIQNEVAISIEGLSKVYKIWKDPIARIKAPLADILHSWSKGILTKSNYLLKRLPRLGSEYDTKEYYKEVHALLNIFFKVRKGEALGIVGMNGSGKSTLLQMLAGTLTPTSGKAHCNGRVAALLELGSGFNPEFTGRENIYLNCAVLGLNKLEIEARINQIIEFSELGEFIEQPVKTYSSGMVVRLAFAAISHVDPDILIVDEALAVGDSYYQHKCTQKIREFKERGGTLLLVSHDPGAIKSICSRCILLDKGKLIKDGPAESVLDYYNAMIAQKEKGNIIKQIEDLSGRLKTRSGNGKATIESVSLLDTENQPAKAFKTGANARIRCIASFNEPISRPTLGILIRDRLGIDIFGTNTYNNNQILADADGGQKMQIDANIKLDLGVGSYSITLALHSEKDHLSESYDWLDHALIVQIIPDIDKEFVGCAALECSFKANKINSLDNPNE